MEDNKQIRVEANEAGIIKLIELGFIENGNIQNIVKEYRDRKIEFISVFHV